MILNLENESSISISPENIKDQLDKILSSELFENKIRLQRFLSFVTNETLDGNAKLIKGYTLGLEVFDKDETLKVFEILKKLNPKYNNLSIDFIKKDIIYIKNNN